jgi:hypothetical protein
VDGQKPASAAASDASGNPGPATPQPPRPGAGGERGVGDLLLAVLAGSALAPFVQTIATKAGDDVYAKIKDLLARRSRKAADRPADAPIVLVDPELALILELPPTLTTTQASRLAALRLPVRSPGNWVLVRYDSEAARWQTAMVGQPPPDAIEVL